MAMVVIERIVSIYTKHGIMSAFALNCLLNVKLHMLTDWNNDIPQVNKHNCVCAYLYVCHS